MNKAMLVGLVTADLLQAGLVAIVSFNLLAIGTSIDMHEGSVLKIIAAATGVIALVVQAMAVLHGTYRRVGGVIRIITKE